MAPIRVWSPADELRILEGLAARAEKYGKLPERSELPDALSVCGLDKADFTVTEIYEKVRRLKDRYFKLRAAGGVTGNGEDLRKYDLSHQIWGSEAAPGQARPTKTKVSKTRAAARRRGFEEMRGLYPHLAAALDGIVAGDNRGMLGATLKRAFELMDDDEAAEWDAKVKKQRIQQAMMTSKRAVLRSQVLDALIKCMLD